ncbi:MAG: Arginine-binding extracellular protein ArtP [Candidatus Anoxychlamydiales bacterium]|nr:Arginine-binding extracellular protein ArtP [Candidatus Anoxychlamydiales bacterium]
MKNKTVIIGLAIVLLAAPFVRTVILKMFPPKELNTLVVGTNAEYPPFAYIENNEIVGFDVDLVKEVCTRLKKDIQILDMPFESLIPAGSIGKVQLIAAGMTHTKERAKKVLFTKPYLVGDQLMIVSLSDSKVDIDSLEDLNHKNVIVNKGYTADLFISSVKNSVKMNLIRLNCPTDGFMALSSNRADAFITSQSNIAQFFKTNTGEDQKYKIAPIIDKNTNDAYSLIVSKKHSYLLDEIEKTIEDMKKDGTITKLKDKWSL